MTQYYLNLVNQDTLLPVRTLAAYTSLQAALDARQSLIDSEEGELANYSYCVSREPASSNKRTNR